VSSTTPQVTRTSVTRCSNVRRCARIIAPCIFVREHNWPGDDSRTPGQSKGNPRESGSTRIIEIGWVYPFFIITGLILSRFIYSQGQSSAENWNLTRLIKTAWQVPQVGKGYLMGHDDSQHWKVNNHNLHYDAMIQPRCSFNFRIYFHECDQLQAFHRQYCIDQHSCSVVQYQVCQWRKGFLTGEGHTERGTISNGR